jgi:four helix bundle protein
LKIVRFEDIEAWKASRRLLRQIHLITSSQGFRQNAELRSQLRRAANSAMANIAEGFNAGSDAEFARFLRISRRSATEAQSHLHSALDQGHITQDDFDRLYGIAEDVKRLIGGFVRYLSTTAGQARPRLTKTEDRGLRTQTACARLSLH